mmetsp:Transcript_10244/g.31827  ORF Transcript_10244/g.31827 Transcript_10244/m.31827 type:complete len:222 (+) Transcript_10244:774-1439(+)
MRGPWRPGTPAREQLLRQAPGRPTRCGRRRPRRRPCPRACWAGACGSEAARREPAVFPRRTRTGCLTRARRGRARKRLRQRQPGCSPGAAPPCPLGSRWQSPGWSCSGAPAYCMRGTAGPRPPDAAAASSGGGTPPWSASPAPCPTALLPTLPWPGTPPECLPSRASGPVPHTTGRGRLLMSPACPASGPGLRCRTTSRSRPAPHRRCRPRSALASDAIRS